MDTNVFILVFFIGIFSVDFISSNVCLFEINWRQHFDYWKYISEILWTPTQAIRLQGAWFETRFKLHLHHERDKSNASLNIERINFSSRCGGYKLLRQYTLKHPVASISENNFGNLFRSTFKYTKKWDQPFAQWCKWNKIYVISLEVIPQGIHRFWQKFWTETVDENMEICSIRAHLQYNFFFFFNFQDRISYRILKFYY